MRRAVRILAGLLGLLLVAALAALVHLGIPRNAAGMAARSVCSAVFVAGRPAAQVFDQDVRPASLALALVRVQVDAAQRLVHGRFAGGFERTARWAGDRGCVLDGAADIAPAAPSATADAAAPAPWPDGNQPLPAAQWGDMVQADRLAAAVDAAFQGAGDPRAANARAVAVVHRGRLLVDRQAPGFGPATALHGWSMTKTVTAMLLHKRAAERGIDSARRVVDLFPPDRPVPAWVDAWRADARAAITLDDLLFMRDGLAQKESYAPWGAVPRMLFGAPDVAAHAAQPPADAAAGQRWRYLSASTNLAARVLRAHFDDDRAYWAYPRQALFDPIGARSAVMETDADGTWIGSSYLWARSGDWARLGQLLLDDGRWRGRQVLPPGFLARADQPAVADGEGRGYGAQLWRIGEPAQGSCKGQLPADALAMRGHWGQIVAVVPSRQAVVVRLGWTFDKARFDGCRFVAEVLAALR